MHIHVFPGFGVKSNLTDYKYRIARNNEFNKKNLNLCLFLNIHFIAMQINGNSTVTAILI